jgi:hypothetical protein
MPNLYDEAIADAKSLKEMAERNARNKIIESISPQIRRMVERQMLAEQDEELHGAHRLERAGKTWRRAA